MSEWPWTNRHDYCGEHKVEPVQQVAELDPVVSPEAEIPVLEQFFPSFTRQGAYAFCGQLLLSQRRILAEKYGISWFFQSGENDTDRDKRVLRQAKEKGVLDALLRDAIEMANENIERRKG